MGSHAVVGKGMTPPEAESYPGNMSDTTAAFGMVRLLQDLSLMDIKESVGIEIDYGSFQLENAMTFEGNADELMAEPAVKIKGNPNAVYTMLLVDADAPTPTQPRYRSYVHWAAVNVPAVDITRGEEVLPYEPPSPAKGRHRYAYLFFKQDGRLDAGKAKPRDRKGFQVSQWCRDHGLDAVPAAGMFFFCTGHQDTAHKEA